MDKLVSTIENAVQPGDSEKEYEISKEIEEDNKEEDAELKNTCWRNFLLDCESIEKNIIR